MAYSYYGSVKRCVDNALSEIRECKGTESLEDYYEFIIESILNDDAVTGAASGSYTFNTETAKEYVLDNIKLAAEAYMYFEAYYYDLAADICNDNWEQIDVVIRQYVAKKDLIARYNL